MLSSTNRAFVGDDGVCDSDRPTAAAPQTLTPSPVPSPLSSPLRCRVYEIAKHRASFDASIGSASASVTLPPTPRPASSASTPAPPLRCRIYEVAKYRAEPMGRAPPRRDGAPARAGADTS